MTSRTVLKILAMLLLTVPALLISDDMPDVRVDPSSVKIQKYDSKKIKLRMFAEIALPQNTGKPLLLASVKSKIYVNDKYVMKADSAKNLEFSESITSDFDVTIRYEDLLKASPALKDKEQVCKVVATFYFIVDRDLGFNTREAVFEQKLPSYKKALKNAVKNAF